MLRDMMDRGMIKSMIFITHELPLLYNVTDDIMVMYAGQIVESGTAREVVFDPIHPYAKGLMDPSWCLRRGCGRESSGPSPAPRQT